MQALSSHYEIYKRVCFYTRLWPQSPFLLSAPGVVTMTFSGVISRNTSPTTSLPSAVTSLNATGTTLGAPLAQVASVCPVCQEALSDEESAEAPPAAEEARRFRGSVPTASRGSGWEPADTTVSAEEHAKKSPPKWVVIFVTAHRFCCLYASHTAKAKSVTRLDSLPASHEWQSHSQEPCRTS